ncbi:hypothetical protein MKEN_00935800 [Mycena kentingensis (nom. inval.)]|nr:hypothetical protein MKEN_00935800 [Mycena kentingensis (nom. inval.)]
MSTVPLGTGPPTRAEMAAYYPPLFTFDQLRAFIASGDLALLKRHKALQERYNLWIAAIQVEYGSTVNYLLNHRLQWGKPDTISLLGPPFPADLGAVNSPLAQLPPTPAGLDLAPPYFSSAAPEEYLSIITNDWPYSVPPDVTHTIVWTRLPIFHPLLVTPDIEARVNQDGLVGFTGGAEDPPLPSLDECLEALADWGVTKEKMIVSEKGTEAEEAAMRSAGRPVHEFVKTRWPEEEWETAWFVNPPRLQSVPGLAHVHVFAQRKTPSTTKESE